MRTSTLSWLLLGAGLAGCQPASDSPQVGSESHFLTTCNASCAEYIDYVLGKEEVMRPAARSTRKPLASTSRRDRPARAATTRRSRRFAM